MFKDRIEAGRRLSEPLLKFAAHDPLVLGMARGGIVLAGEVARELGAELDVLVVRKIGAPSNPEFGVGAVAPLEVTVLDYEAIESLDLSPEDLRPVINRELAEVDRRLRAYRNGLQPLDARNRTVILVDDGLATGITAVAAARYVKKLGASYVIFAAPVCSRPGMGALEREVEEIVCLQSPEMFFAVGLWYEDFSQVEDSDVLEVMSATRKREFMA
jgi:predicted phosphoribosyltransferase